MKIYYILSLSLIANLTYALTIKDLPGRITVQEDKDENLISLVNKKLTDIEGIEDLPVEYQQELVSLSTVPNLSLYLSDNQLTRLPDTIGQLANLQQLYLSYNQLTSLPDAIGQLANLHTLYLSDNQLTSLPDAIGQLASLQWLDISDNKLTSLPDTIVQLANLEELDLWNNKLTSLPDTIVQLANLEELYLSGNQLTSLPDTIVQLANLQKLYLSGNKLTSLPDTIGQLANLYTLDLSGNKLTRLPDTIGQLANLHTLYLSDNQLTSLPDTLGQLANLEELYLADNQLTSLSDTFGQLANLQWLKLSGNQLTSLPDSLNKLPLLKVLTSDIRQQAYAIMNNIKAKRGPVLADWQLVNPDFLPIRFDGTYNMLDLSDMGLRDITGIDKLTVRIWDAEKAEKPEDKKWGSSSLAKVENLGINLSSNPLDNLPIDQLLSLPTLAYLKVSDVSSDEQVKVLAEFSSLQRIDYTGSNEEVKKLTKQFNTRNKTLSAYARVYNK